jgi:ElaB/YqjD/DUF883 family membrane-anchored ribosome-binding protein
MDRPQDQPLSLEEAKARLREAAQQATMTGFVKRRPYTAVTLAFAAGAVLGSSPKARGAASRELIRLLLRSI